MPITNKTKKTEVASRYRVCKSMTSKAKGLMFTDKAFVREAALLFEFNKPTRQSLHMFFVFYPIDLIFLDENKCVVELKQNFRPFQTYNSSKKSKYVLETHDLAISKSKTQVPQ